MLYLNILNTVVLQNYAAFEFYQAGKII